MKVQETFFCDCCKKKFKNEVTYKNHCNSKKHLKKFKEFEKIEAVKTDEKEEITEVVIETTLDNNNRCLFSNHLSNSIEE